MADRLISADDLVERAYRLRLDGRELIAQMILSAPTVDAVPVVRCKDCKFGVIDGAKYFCSTDGRIWCDGDWYCANGERREDEAD